MREMISEAHDIGGFDSLLDYKENIPVKSRE